MSSFCPSPTSTSNYFFWLTSRRCASTSGVELLSTRLQLFPSRPVEVIWFVTSLVAATPTSYFSFNEGEKTSRQITHQSDRHLSLSPGRQTLQCITPQTSRGSDCTTFRTNYRHSGAISHSQPTARGYLFLSAIKRLRLLSGSIAGWGWLSRVAAENLAHIFQLAFRVDTFLWK